MRVTGVMRVIGVVKWFDIRHGCGIISRSDGAADCLVRQSGMQGTALRIVAPGDAVEFEVMDHQRGPTARNVVRLAARYPNAGPDVERHASA